MDLNDYQKAALTTAGDFGDKSTKLLYGALAVAGEAGEFADYVKKMCFHRKDVSPETLILELGDVLWGIAFAADALGYDLQAVGTANLEKLKARYPNGFVDGGGIR